MASTSQEFDVLDGLIVTGTTTLATVDINGGTVDGLTQLTVDNLTLNNQTVESSNLLVLKSGAANAIDLDAGAGAIRLEDSSVEFGRFTQSGGELKISTGPSNTTALTFQSDGTVETSSDLIIKDSANTDGIKLTAATASSYLNTINHGDTGLEFNNNSTSRGYNWSVNNSLKFSISSSGTADFYGNVVLNSSNMDLNGGYIDDVEYIQLRATIYHHGDNNTYMQFHANDKWRIVTNAVSRLIVEDAAVTVTNQLDAPIVHSSKYFEETVYNGGSGTAYTMNINNGSVHKYQPTGNYSIDFTNFPTSGAATFTLIIDNNGTSREPTWPGTSGGAADGSGPDDRIYWSEGIEPPNSSGIDIYSFYVVDGKIYGSLGIRNAGWAR